MYINARLISSDLMDLLYTGTLAGTVHSVFDRACNISLENGRLVSLITPGAVNSPSSIKLDVEDDFSLRLMHIMPGTGVELADKRLTFMGNNISIKLADAEVWDAFPRFIRPRLPQYTVRKNLELIRQIVMNYGSREGFAPLLDISHTNPLVGFIVPHLKRLAAALTSRNYTLIEETAGSIIGFGPGLTPSGDDFLLGVMASLFYLGSYSGYNQDSIRKLTGSLICNIEGRTTIISQAMLQNGAIGLFNEPLRNLVNAVISRDGVEKECLELLKIGETSGSDCAAGVIFGGDVLLGMKGIKEVSK